MEIFQDFNFGHQNDDFVQFSDDKTSSDVEGNVTDLVNFEQLKPKVKTSTFKDFLEDNLGSVIKCPITSCGMFSPVVASDGFIYEESQLATMKKYGYGGLKSPMTREKLEPILISIPLVKELIEYADKHGLEASKEKFIMTDSFEDNFDIISNALLTGKFDEVFKFKKFILNHVNPDGMSMCEVMLKAKSYDFVKLLSVQKYIVENSETINANFSHGWNILHLVFKLSATVQFIEYIMDIIKNKLKLNINTFNVADAYGKTPIDYLVERGNPELIMCIFNSELSESVNVLKLATTCIETCSTSSLVLKVLDKLSNLNQFYNGTSPLFTAIKMKRIEIIKYLFERGASIDLKAPSGMNAVHYACQTGNSEIAKMFIDKCTNLEEESYDGWRLIHIACHYCTRDVIEYLIEKDVRVNTPITKYKGSDKQYLPINLLELNQRIKDSELDIMSEFMIQLMEIQTV